MRKILLGLLFSSFMTSAYALEDIPPLPQMSFTDTNGKTYKVQGTEQ